MTGYVHDTPGRLRVKIPTLRNDPLKSRKVVNRLAGVDGVVDVNVNPVTGSVIIRYDCTMIQSNRLIGCLSDDGLLDSGNSAGANAAAQERVTEFREKVGKALLGWAVGKALERSGLSILAGLI